MSYIATPLIPKTFSVMQADRVPFVGVERAKRGEKCERLIGWRGEKDSAKCGGTAQFALLIRWRHWPASAEPQRSPLCWNDFSSVIDSLLEMPESLILEDLEYERIRERALSSATCTAVVKRHGTAGAHICGREPTTHCCRYCNKTSVNRFGRHTFRHYSTIKRGRVERAAKGDPILVRGALCAMHAMVCSRHHPAFVETMPRPESA